ncbi:unnamed protein product [Staurois parvus]|uniref:Uncharacterized protein n=1 Tax=Staurois parvus TaxID=386267 RepID=A0ABN9EWZ9_9NEOB|nr:unnamed protein product [Staurois parvus]
MIGTSHRGPIQRSVFHCVLQIQQAPDRDAARFPGSAHKHREGRTFINGHLPLHCSHSAVYIHGPDRK